MGSRSFASQRLVIAHVLLCEHAVQPPRKSTIPGGKSMAAPVALEPEHGTVGKEVVREAAKEAAEFADILIVCGFAFEALVEDETKVGKLRILKAKMNPDLQMPDLLKKTGAGLAEVLPDKPHVGRPRDYPKYMWIVYHALVTTYGRAHAGWRRSSVTRWCGASSGTIKRQFPDDQAMWLPKKPMRRWHYAHAVKDYLRDPAILE